MRVCEISAIRCDYERKGDESVTVNHYRSLYELTDLTTEVQSACRRLDRTPAARPTLTDLQSLGTPESEPVSQSSSKEWLKMRTVFVANYFLASIVGGGEAQSLARVTEAVVAACP